MPTRYVAIAKAKVELILEEIAVKQGDSIYQKITRKLCDIDEGEIFSTQIFRPLGSQSSIQRALARLVRENVIVRLTQGYYVKPQKSRFGEILPSPESLARFWAAENGYKLVDQAWTEVNRLGLSTQVPMMVVLWSNGPSKQFAIGKSAVEIRHVSDRSLRLEAGPASVLYRALSVLHPDDYSAAVLNGAFDRLDWSEESKATALKMLLNSDLSKAWKKKLNGLKYTDT